MEEDGTIERYEISNPRGPPTVQISLIVDNVYTVNNVDIVNTVTSDEKEIEDSNVDTVYTVDNVSTVNTVTLYDGDSTRGSGGDSIDSIDIRDTTDTCDSTTKGMIGSVDDTIKARSKFSPDPGDYAALNRVEYNQQCAKCGRQGVEYRERPQTFNLKRGTSGLCGKCFEEL